MQKMRTVSRILAPEDLREGDYVAVLRATFELPSFLWGGDTSIRPPEQPIRYVYSPCDSGTPLRVKSICLPFLFVRSPTGTHSILDLRRTELTRLTREYAETVCKKLEKDTRKARREC